MAKKKRTHKLPQIKLKRPVLLSVLGIVIGVAVILLFMAGYTIRYQDKIYPKTQVGTVNLGNKTQREAEQLLNEKISQLPAEITISVDGIDPIKVATKEFGLSYNIKETVSDAY